MGATRGMLNVIILKESAIIGLIGIILSQILAKYSDKQDDRRKVMIVCCLIAVLGCLIFAYSRNYYVLIIIGTTLLGLGSSANPQSFALAREYAESSHREAVMFTTIMRTQISLAWIVGPPLSFFIALNWGFDYMYLVAGWNKDIVVWGKSRKDKPEKICDRVK